MITIQEMDEMREFARYFVRKQREDLKKMRQGDRPDEEQQVLPPELPEELPDDMNTVPPPRRI